MNLPVNSNKENILKLENVIKFLNDRIENLKTEYNLYFSGEIKLPPERERESLEKSVRELLRYRQLKSSSLNLLIQNVNSKFGLYNNMWKKRLSQIESGLSRFPRKEILTVKQIDKKPVALPKKQIEKVTTKQTEKVTTINLNLNNENSFDFFIKEFKKSFPDKSADRDKIINNLKLKMISENIISAKASLSLKNGKIKISIKRTI
jgi:hypothetical protein